MSEDLFKLFDKVNKQYMKSLEGYKEPVCKHETVFEGTCEACYEVVWVNLVNDSNFHDRTSVH